MEQQSETWHEWRGKGLGSSDAPIIMGTSPWKTAYQLWEEKTKKVKNTFKGNFATDRGNRLEPMIRACYEFEQNHEAPPILCSNPQYPFIRASLDGYCVAKNIILEIKAPGQVDHATALEGKVPEKYYPQLQHQLLAMPEAKLCHYYSSDGKESRALVEVTRDPEYQEKLLEALTKFWKCVAEDTPPELTDRDFKRISSRELEDLLIDYGHLTQNIAKLEETLSEIKAKILNHTEVENRRVQIGDKWKIGITHRKGSIDYGKIPILKGMDLEPYRKSGSTFRTIAGSN
jgi:putative phage-type endonuclease